MLVFATGALLPEQVASHFGGSGRADAFMSRGGYQFFILLFAVGIPLFIVGLVSILPRLFPRFVNLPNRDYWLAPDRRDQTLDYLSCHALVFGCMLVVFICGVHGLVVQANARNPPQLANGPFIALLLSFLVAGGLWTARLMRRFRKIPD